MAVQLTAQKILDYYQLQAHPEGGYYKETYRSEENIKTGLSTAAFPENRSYGTAIYFLLAGGDFSAFHRIKSDEIWHFYAGGPLFIHIINPQGQLTTVTLGSDIAAGQTFQAIVFAGCWFASEPVNKESFSFVGCTVAPGFEFEDFELTEENELSALFPQYADLIKRLTRI